MAASPLGHILASVLLGASVITPAGVSASGVDGHQHEAALPTSSTADATLKSMIAAPLSKRVNPAIARIVRDLSASAPMQKALTFLKADEERFIKESIQISEIPAPTFQEEKRAQAFASMLKANGIADTRMDSIGNVIGIRKGQANGPKVAIIAHLDTVFNATTNVKVRKQGNLLLGPGLTDDSNGLAMMLSWIRALQAAKIQTNAELMFVGSVGEEGNGDLRGVKQFFKDHTTIDAVVILEGALPPEVIGIMNTGSNRFQVDFQGPGGHSYGAFGLVPSAIHAQGRFIAKVADLQVPAQPKTTFTVGIVRGGRSVNTIAPDASLEIDIRSNGNAELQATTAKILSFINAAVAEENRRWGTTTLRQVTKQIGSRPGGATSPEHAIVQTWQASALTQGIRPEALVGASTDAGVPIARGIPTIVMGCGGKTGGFHAVDENWDPTDAYKGVQLGFLTTMSLAGVQGVSQPTLLAR